MSERREVVQLCGAISGREIEAWEQFNEAEVNIKAKFPNVVVINPLKLCDYITDVYKAIGDEPPYRHYLDLCLSSLIHVDLLIVLDKADGSKGCQEEMQKCWELGKEIIKLEDYLG